MVFSPLIVLYSERSSFFILEAQSAEILWRAVAPE
jgi:hypothetical protein